MKRWVTLPLVVLGACLAAAAAETRVAITADLRGALVKPDRGWNGSAALLLHGFASDMDDAGGLYRRLAHALAAKGIASLRINFRGEGDAQRTRIESTFGTRLQDAATAYAWLVEQPGVNASRLGVVGWSLGASTAIEIGAQYPDWFKSMAVWSSPGGDQFVQMTDNPTAQAALRDGEATEDVPGWKRITTRREFYLSFRGIDLDKSLAKYPGAFLTVRGTEDHLRIRRVRVIRMDASGSPVVETKELPDPDDVFLAVAAGEPKEKLRIDGADHVFNVFQPETGHAANAVAATAAWFQRTL
jgi:pimeloyl-ACP methyl ester carboxylesterase